MTKQKVLVTGAGGFTGSAVTAELLAQGYPVRAMVRAGSKGHDRLRRLGAEVFEADLTDATSLDRAVSGVSAVIHVAALFRQAGLPESEFHRVNVEGTRTLLNLSVRYGIKRFVHCSTVGVHGDIENPPGNEDTPFNPGDMYQRSKLDGEQLVRRYFSEGMLRGVVIRPAMIYGPGDQRTIKLFRMISRRKFFYVGKGEALVHFIDVRDLARAFVLALEAEQLNDKVYIIAGKEFMPLKEIARRIALVMHVDPPFLHLPVRPMQWLGSLCEAV